MSRVIIETQSKNFQKEEMITSSLHSALEEVFEQIGGLAQLEERGRLDPLYRELLLCMAEVRLFPDDMVLKVAGSEVTARLVKEVYGMLEADHLQAVYRSFLQIAHPIRNRKAYLRTALYNAAFELEAGIINEAARDWRKHDEWV